jgi:hypothetical protein
VEWQTHFLTDGLIESLWNAVYTQDGSRVTASGEDWNKLLDAGTTADFGFCARRPAQAPQPACADEFDNDGDGLADFPADPGCISSDDNDEADAAPGTIQAALIDPARICLQAA